MLLHPSANTFRAMRAFASNVSNDIGDACEGGQAGDQSFLNAFFRERWMQLPPTVVSHVRFWEISTRRHLPRRVETGRWESFEPGTGRPGPWQAIMPHVADQSKDASEAVCRRLCKPNSGLPLTQKPPARLPRWMSRRWRAYCWCWVPRSNASENRRVAHDRSGEGKLVGVRDARAAQGRGGDVVGGPVFLPSAAADEFSPILPSADIEGDPRSARYGAAFFLQREYIISELLLQPVAAPVHEQPARGRVAGIGRLAQPRPRLGGVRVEGVDAVATLAEALRVGVALQQQPPELALRLDVAELGRAAEQRLGARHVGGAAVAVVAQQRAQRRRARGGGSAARSSHCRPTERKPSSSIT